jgi:hypothetical protein
MTQIKRKKAIPVFSCKPNGEMYDVVDGVLIPKQVKKQFYKSKTKIKNNGKQS